MTCKAAPGICRLCQYIPFHLSKVPNLGRPAAIQIPNPVSKHSRGLLGGSGPSILLKSFYRAQVFGREWKGGFLFKRGPFGLGILSRMRLQPIVCMIMARRTVTLFTTLSLCPHFASRNDGARSCRAYNFDKEFQN